MNETAGRLLPALPSQARRCRGEGCGLRTECLRNRSIDARPVEAPVLDNLCNYEEDRPALILAPQSA